MAPRFVVTGPERLNALLARLVEQEIAASAARPPREPARGDTTVTVLDLDRGSTSTAPETPAEKSAWTKLALLLLAPSERTLLLGHWAGLADAALAAKVDVAR